MNNADDAHKMSFILKISGATKGMHSANKNAFIMFKEWQHVLSMKLSIAMMCV